MKNQQSKIILRCRSLLFDTFFYGFSIVYLSAVFVPTMLLPRACCSFLFRTWAATVMGGLRFIIGLRYEEKNRNYLVEALKDGPVILACKHQSAWETIFCPLVLKEFVIVLKKQLLFVPIFGLYLQKINSISIDKSQGIKSLRNLLKQCQKAVAKKRSIFIFPEGHRTPYGEKGTYQPGIVAVYQELKIPVIPVGLNSGRFWPRKACIKYPGCINVVYGKPIPPNLPKAEFKKILAERIEYLSALASDS